MGQFAGWPAPVTGHLRRTFGEPVAVERLGGMSVARVYRVRFQAGSAIVKTSPRPRERLFYERVAGRLRAAGVPIPRLEWSARVDGAHWLILEDIPHPFPIHAGDGRRPDPRILTVLARLHVATHGLTLDLPPTAIAAWTDAATEAALKCFPAPTAAALAPALRALQGEAVRLAEPWCWISGDPSAPNWGLRANGTPALYDWELFRPGLPAADLAPVVPGLGDANAYRDVAAGYLRARAALGHASPWPLDVLARDVAVAKAATVVLLLAAAATGAARVPAEHVAWLAAAAPSWVQSLA